MRRMIVALVVGGAAVWAAAALATPTRGHAAPAKLVGVWHRKMTQAQWSRYEVSRPAGLYTMVFTKDGQLWVFLPGSYRASCGISCSTPDFITPFTTAGPRLTLATAPVCGFKGIYHWAVSRRTLILRAIADRSCPPREALFGGRFDR